jgi:hypothetical protein
MDDRRSLSFLLPLLHGRLGDLVACIMWMAGDAAGVLLVCRETAAVTEHILRKMPRKRPTGQGEPWEPGRRW